MNTAMEAMECDWIASHPTDHHDNPTSTSQLDDPVEQQLHKDKPIAADKSESVSNPSISLDALLLNRPIVVGYAFGPKKMSTMGVVMAEASKAKLTAATASTSSLTSRSTAAGSNGAMTNMTDAYAKAAAGGASINNILIIDSNGDYRGPAISGDEYLSFPVSQSRQASTFRPHAMEDSSNTTIQPLDSPETQSFVFTMDLLNGKEESCSGLQSVVRQFRSSCSSVGSVSTVLTANSSLTSKTKASTRSFASTSTKYTKREQQQEEVEQRIPIRVSFVPLDPGASIDPISNF